MHRQNALLTRVSEPPGDARRSVPACRSTRGKCISIAVITALCAAFAPASADPGDMPNVKLTPGAVATENVPVVCRSGYARSVRPKSAVWPNSKAKPTTVTVSRAGIAERSTGPDTDMPRLRSIICYTP